MKAVCPSCNKTFENRRNRHVLRFCSNDCVNAWQSGLSLEDYLEKRNQVSLNKIRRKLVRVLRQVFKEELIEIQRQKNVVRSRERYRKNLASEKIQKYCLECGEPFTTSRSRARYCSPVCAKQNERRVQRLKNSGCSLILDRDITVDKLFRMQDGRCANCGKELNLSTHYQSSNAPTIDHIIPIVRGGTHSWGNVQMLCLSCNSSKGDTPMPPLETFTPSITPARSGLRDIEEKFSEVDRG